MKYKEMLDSILSGDRYSVMVSRNDGLSPPPYFKAGTPYKEGQTHIGWDIDIINTARGQRRSMPYWEPIESYKSRLGRFRDDGESLDLYIAATDIIGMIVSMTACIDNADNIQTTIEQTENSPLDFEKLMDEANKTHDILSQVFEYDLPILKQALMSNVIFAPHEFTGNMTEPIHLNVPIMQPYNYMSVPNMTTLLRYIIDDVIWDGSRYTDPLAKGLEIWLDMDPKDPASYGLPAGWNLSVNS